MRETRKVSRAKQYPERIVPMIEEARRTNARPGLGITWSLRLSRDVPIDPMPLSLPLALARTSQLVESKRTSPVAGRLVHANPVEILWEQFVPRGEPDRIGKLGFTSRTKRRVPTHIGKTGRQRRSRKTRRRRGGGTRAGKARGGSGGRRRARRRRPGRRRRGRGRRTRRRRRSRKHSRTIRK